MTDRFYYCCSFDVESGGNNIFFALVFDGALMIGYVRFGGGQYAK